MCLPILGAAQQPSQGLGRDQDPEAGCDHLVLDLVTAGADQLDNLRRQAEGGKKEDQQNLYNFYFKNNNFFGRGRGWGSNGL